MASIYKIEYRYADEYKANEQDREWDKLRHGRE